MWRDFIEGPELSREEHFREFVTLANVDVLGRHGWKTESERDELVSRMMGIDFSIHYHVWTPDGMIELVTRARKELGLCFDILQFLQSGDEGIFILRRRA